MRDLLSYRAERRVSAVAKLVRFFDHTNRRFFFFLLSMSVCMYSACVMHFSCLRVSASLLVIVAGKRVGSCRK